FDLDDNARFAAMNSCVVVAGEFGEACKEYPLLWVRAGQDDKGVQQVAPIAVFGLTKQSNLCFERNRWRMQYVPAIIRMYPFAMARAGTDQWVLCYDASSPRFSLTDGEPLFEPDGQPAALTLEVKKQLEQLEADGERTRQAGSELLRLDLLREMRYDAKLSDGTPLSVDGFLAVDDKRFGELADADVLALHRKGVLGLIHAHQLSLSNMRRLAQWHAERTGSAPRAGAAAPAQA
ncbi:MAG TPA: SapC family protein, partial [Burkholderiaceae bacterium]|nr:SapC family protein [Burkholderiaceae bacterium]